MASDFERELGFSKGEINRAGDASRRYEYSGPAPENQRANELITIFRNAHAHPQFAVRNKLDWFAERMHSPLVLTWRLKRVPRIRTKLKREPGMKLARMGDIGGCRMVFPILGEVQALAHFLTRPPMNRALQSLFRLQIVAQRNYISNPKATGYRGFHIYVQEGAFQIEIQLRSKLQHAWAEFVDQWSTDELSLKDGEGPTEIQQRLRSRANRFAQMDAQRKSPLEDAHIEAELESLHHEVVPLL